MSFLLWHRAGDTRIAGSHRVLRAAEVPLLREAQALRDALEALHAQAEARIAAAARVAAEDGHAEGFAAGFREGEQRVLETIAALQHRAGEEREHLRNEIGALALQVVRKMLGGFAEPELLVALADTATREVLPAPPLAIVVALGAGAALRERFPALEVREDASAPAGSCRIETAHGSLDVSIDAQLGRLAQNWRVT